MPSHFARMWETSPSIKPRPVFNRVKIRELGIDPGPPTEAERADAILLLAEPWHDSVGDEAFRMLDEYGR